MTNKASLPLDMYYHNKVIKKMTIQSTRVLAIQFLMWISIKKKR